MKKDENELEGEEDVEGLVTDEVCKKTGSMFSGATGKKFKMTCPVGCA